ncbi:MAG: hypothetical protein HUU37_01345 [Bdellovibrionales bacterium]|nr:hypothetical protein [Bdellovibrionales bacterium]
MSHLLKHMTRLARKLLRWAFGLLPKPIRHALVRRVAALSEKPNPDLTVKLAETYGEFEGAFRVLHDSYVKVGYCKPQPSGLRLTPHHILPSSAVVVAKLGRAVVGTLTLVRDNKLRLPMEKHWDLSFLRKFGARVAEITCLAIDPRHRRAVGADVFFPLLKFMYEYSTKQFGTDHLGVVIHPRDVDFYEGVLFFRRVDRRVIDYYGAPAIALYLDLQQAVDRFRSCYSGKEKRYDLFEYFVHAKLATLRFPAGKEFLVDPPGMSRAIFEEIFLRRTNLLDELTPEQIEKISRHFPRRRDEMASRYAVEIVGRLLGSNWFTAILRIKDVSKTGMRLMNVPPRITVSSELILELRPEPGRHIVVRSKVAWIHPEFGAGLSVPPGQKDWDRFVSEIERPLAERGQAFLASVKKAA